MVWDRLKCQPYRIPYQSHGNQTSKDDHQSYPAELEMELPAARQRSDAEFARGVPIWILGEGRAFWFMVPLRILLDPVQVIYTHYANAP
jgi:hypothetical protein